MKKCCQRAQEIVAAYQALQIGPQVSHMMYTIAARDANDAATHMIYCKQVRGSTETVKCANCRESKNVRTADRRRGWGRFCSKSCKAEYQTRGGARK
jgi:hypothetical protein